jgi:hypothetical protein
MAAVVAATAAALDQALAAATARLPATGHWAAVGYAGSRSATTGIWTDAPDLARLHGLQVRRRGSEKGGA